MDWTGGCLCGALRYLARADPIRVVSCHCGVCRRVSGAAFMTFVHFPAGDFAWTGGAPQRYRSSAGAERGFCPVCGSTLTMHEAVLADRVQVSLGSLAGPGPTRRSRLDLAPAALAGAGRRPAAVSDGQRRAALARAAPSAPNADDAG